MPRILSSALLTELAKTVTTVGYLVQIGTTTPQRWSNIGAVTWNALAWSDMDFVVEGLEFSSDVDLTARLTVQNLDGVAAALFLSASEHLYNVVVTIYQFAHGALGVGDVPLIAVMAVDACDVGLDKVVLSLTDANVDAAFSPRRRVAPTDGFNFAAPGGTVIAWGNEILTLAPSDG
jgi:hypothetical protein